MVKLHTTQTSYSYPFPAVTLAYFLRYPNPHSTHVLSTDVISRHLDPATGRLHSTRLHLKQSKLPPAVLKMLPSSILSGGPRGPNGEAQNFILETSVVDPAEGWMETETRNLQYTGVLSVVERQRYSRPKEVPAAPAATAAAAAASPSGPARPEIEGMIAAGEKQQLDGMDIVRQSARDDLTHCETTVTFVSRFGLWQQQAPKAQQQQTPVEPRKSFFSTWSTGAVQRTIEASGMSRTRTAMVKSKEGMIVVLERMRVGGLGGVLEGMRRDRELYMGGGNEKIGGGGGGGGGKKWEGVWRENGDKGGNEKD